jgi:rSAM/selenodomain-associated transferase 1
MNDAGTLIIVFAKAPDAGRVKTRLAPVLGAAGAARLQARLTRRALETALAAGCGTVELWCAPLCRHPFFQRAATRYRVALRAQGRGSVGTRMQHAIERGLRSHARVVLMGSDCPSLKPAHLRAAARALRKGADAVFSPAEDGGYALIGARRSSPRLFSGIAWGTCEVMAETRRRLRSLGWRWHELPQVWDVDRPEDYARLRRTRLLEKKP